ncbi:MAG: glycosyl hydrolase, partial [Planctomycetes bacterium]|nr:glycosyl hydrolase [Planctomycetota bacterium]
MTRPLLLVIVSLFLASHAHAQVDSQGALQSAQLDGVRWRSVGPASMGGRIVDLAVREDKPAVFYLGAATGGVWKTTNAGTTLEPVFDNQGSGSVGAVAISQSQPDTVWVGTGEANARNSCSYGDGIYKSVDGGKTWAHMGLADSRHIARIVVHPSNPDIVYVAALGHVWGPNPMRGLYKTVDGGKTWTQSLSLNGDTGCVDLRLHPSDPDVVYAAAYEVRRDGFDTNDPAVKYGEKAGLYRSLDAGASWSKLSGGLPTCKYGRIGLDTC